MNFLKKILGNRIKGKRTAGVCIRCYRPIYFDAQGLITTVCPECVEKHKAEALLEKEGGFHV